MQVTRLAPGLWRWTAPHPSWTPEQGGPDGWPQEVGSVYCERERGVVLFDPLAPRAGTPEAATFWDALDRDVSRAGGSVDVLLGNQYHGRSAREIRERYSATTWAHRDAAEALDVGPLRTFADGDELPGGIEAFPIVGLTPGEIAYYLPEHRAAIFADSLLGAGGGKVRLPRRDWAADGARYDSGLRPSLRRLLDLPLSALLVSHGEVVLHEAARALAEALEAPAPAVQ
jgi:glyoxylase-like metal-dependent hydrolase (beta-lactamase superfamily II)